MVEMDTKSRDNGMISKIIIWAAIFTVVFDMLNQFSFFIFGSAYFELLINALSYIILALTIYWISRYPKKFILLKILILVTFCKFVYYAVVLHQYSFQKGILIIPLVLLMIFYNEEFPIITYRVINKYKYVLLILFLLTFIPFIGRYSRADFPRVFSALWIYPQCAAYYLLAFMLLISKNNIFVSSIFLLLIVITGARSAIVPAFIYMVYIFIINIKESLSMKKQLTFTMFFSIFLLLSLFIYPNFFKPFQEQLSYRFTPLFEERILDPSYGAGRTALHMIVFDEIKKFNVFELLFGRSAVSMYDIYESTFGTRNWPHNDFITTLYIYGLIGLLLYLYYLFILPLRRIPPNRLSKIIFVEVTIFILALTNGFYTYVSSYLFLLIYGVLYRETSIVENE